MFALKVGHAFQSQISPLQTSDGINPPYEVQFAGRSQSAVFRSYLTNTHNSDDLCSSFSQDGLMKDVRVLKIAIEFGILWYHAKWKVSPDIEQVFARSKDARSPHCPPRSRLRQH